jgi:hypothetical protein
MTTKTRIDKLEQRQAKPAKITWKEFITLGLLPPELRAAWQKFTQANHDN